MSVSPLSSSSSSSDFFGRFLGRDVRDLYGGYIGKVSILGMDGVGKVSSIGVDAGIAGYLEVPYERVAVKDEIVVVVPNWKFEAAKVSRELILVKKRAAALEDLLKSDEISKSDYQFMMQEYSARSVKLQEQLRSFSASLQKRAEELRNQRIAARKVLVNLKILFKSEEVDSSTYSSSLSQVEEIVERLEREENDLLTILEIVKPSSKNPPAEERADEPQSRVESGVSGDKVDEAKVLSQENKHDDGASSQSQQQSTWFNKIIRVGKS